MKLEKKEFPPKIPGLKRERNILKVLILLQKNGVKKEKKRERERDKQIASETDKHGEGQRQRSIVKEREK